MAQLSDSVLFQFVWGFFICSETSQRAFSAIRVPICIVRDLCAIKASPHRKPQTTDRRVVALRISAPAREFSREILSPPIAGAP